MIPPPLENAIQQFTSFQVTPKSEIHRLKIQILQSHYVV